MALFDPVAWIVNRFSDAKLFTATPDFDLTDLGSSLPKENAYYPLVQQRQAFLRADAETKRKQVKETVLTPLYEVVGAKHHNAVESFISCTLASSALRGTLKGWIDEPGVPLCLPSDVLLDTGGLKNPEADETMPVIGDPTANPHQKRAQTQFIELKNYLGF